jgi:hypothetical protein
MPADRPLTVFASSEAGEWVNLSVRSDTFDENVFRQDWHKAVEAAYVVGDDGMLPRFVTSSVKKDGTSQEYEPFPSGFKNPYEGGHTSQNGEPPPHSRPRTIAPRVVVD